MAKSEMGDVMKRLYPATSVTPRPHPLLDGLPDVPKPTAWMRLKNKVAGWRYSLGMWVAGMPLGDDEEWDD